MNIVETKNYGSTKIRICDDCCRNVDQREAERLIETITEKVRPYLQTKNA